MAEQQRTDVHTIYIHEQESGEKRENSNPSKRMKHEARESREREDREHDSLRECMTKQNNWHRQ